MYKIASFANDPLARELCDRLEEAGISAEQSFNVGVSMAANVGGEVEVWVKDEDAAAATPIAAAFLEEVQARASDERCFDCGYDLRGHAGEGQCPECGRQFLRRIDAVDVPCPACGEDVPGNFEVCWNCGESMDGTAEGLPT